MKNNTDHLSNAQKNKDKGEDEGNTKRKNTDQHNPQDAASKKPDRPEKPKKEK